jgi:glycosyltransferase involved in cell wall biosynthesis
MTSERHPEHRPQHGHGGARRPVVAYVLKSFPRLSETFVTSEIYRLERSGVALRLFVIKREREPLRHELAERIHSPLVHLPDAAPISNLSLIAWLRTHGARFRPAAVRTIRRHPFRVARAAGLAAMHAVRARKGRWSPRKSPVKELLQALALADGLLAAGDVTHVHAHFCHSATTVAWLAAMITKLPLSFTAHAKDVHCADLNPAGLLDRKLRAARFVVTCTEGNRRLLQSRTSTPVHCLYHGLDAGFEELCEAAPRARPMAPRVRALAVGRLVAKKGFDVFVDACAILRARGLDVEAVVVGESGEAEGALRRRILEHGLEAHVTLAGPMTHTALFEEYRRSTVFCLPCRVLENGDRDGIPNVIAEAMAAGVPVVTTPVAGIPELLENGSNALIVAPDDAAALADAVERLHRDPQLAHRLAATGARTIRDRFDARESIAVLARLLQGAAA